MNFLKLKMATLWPKLTDRVVCLFAPRTIPGGLKPTDTILEPLQECWNEAKSVLGRSWSTGTKLKLSWNHFSKAGTKVKLS